MPSRSRRDRAAGLLDARPLRALLARLPTWRGVLALNYHRVGDPDRQPWDRTLWSATAEGLDAQLGVLAKEADVIGPEALAEVAGRGRGRHVLITFDDGYRDNHDVAFPLLRRHGLRATFFLATGFLDRPHAAWWDEIAWMVRNATSASIAANEWTSADIALAEDPDRAAARLVRRYKELSVDRAKPFLEHLAEATGSGRCPPAEVAETWMTWDMARALRDGGMAIGGHTVTHPVLANLPLEAQEEEIGGCEARLRAELGEPMRWFSYPVGARDSFTAETKAVARRHGVEAAFSFYGGHARFGAWDPLDIPRVHVGPALDAPQLRALARLPPLFARPDPVGAGVAGE